MAEWEGRRVVGEQSKKNQIDQATKDKVVKTAFAAWRERPEDLDAAAVVELWEAMWEAADFSWEGLADAGWGRKDGPNAAQVLKRWRAPADFPGGGETHGEGEIAWKEATLQDYWRWSLGYEGDERGTRRLSDNELRIADLLLKAPDGTLWHRLHLRPDASLDLDGSATELRNAEPGDGADKSGFGGGSLSHVLLARLAVGFEAGGNGPDGALRLIGARAKGLGDVLRNYSESYVEGPDDRPRIYLDARLAALRFFDVHGAHFHGTTEFASARFHGVARFDGTQFHGLSWFAGAHFHSAAEFASAHFHGTTEFASARFHSLARFDTAQFHGQAGFGGAHFDGAALFANVQFHRAARFAGAHFHGTAEFGGAHFHGLARFVGAQLHGAAWFGGALFHGATWFGGAHFHGGAKFDGAHFHGFAGFNDVEFWNKADAGPVGFRTAQFFELADFSRCRLPNQPARIQGAFETARFMGEARFRSPDFTAFAAFDGAVFKGKLLLAAARTEREEQSRFDAVLRATKAAVKADGGYSGNERGANNRFAALEGGLRVLKTAMEAEKDHMQEHRFFRFELQAKRRRPSVSRLEKVASWSYGLLSDYGNSMGRPLAALGLSVLLLWVVYWGWGLSLDPSFLGVEKERTALEFSIRNVVQPFSPWTATTRSTLFELDIVKIVSCGKPAETACPSNGGFGWLAFRLLATLQSVFSLLLAFLFALALRKKFQIS
ncbi:pentapeptide repeat-containing protein [Nisaea acidiphila]|uniref:Pentapeptide repeat-containing protein n=1 Tax=Nisaea acidiphila TaxID=1862145 RepID=A0A9J7AZC7_9PROT|nr:pentapeptide repeat-containing protein [Nisaea acidiphila]UUX51777.1 pentapeptide repeat-containing protein [Nisaea acidiphila]